MSVVVVVVFSSFESLAKSIICFDRFNVELWLIVVSGVFISNLKLLQSFSIRKHSIQSATKVSDEKLYH